jgi:hypothetical protein
VGGARLGRVFQKQLTFLNNWAADPRAHEPWDAIRVVGPDISAQAFIRKVLWTYSLSGMLDALSAGADSEVRTERKALRKLLKKLASEPSDSVLAEKLSEAARRAHSIARLVEEITNPSSLVQQVSRLTRQGWGDTCSRKIFMRSLGAQFLQISGHRLDSAVALLTEIAFPGQEIHPEHVRTARRPTTRKARKRNTEFPATAGK